MTDLAEQLGNEYGGWVDSAVAYGKSGDKWIDIPVAYNGNMINYRKSALKEAGFDGVPGDTAGFLDLAKKLHDNGKPMGMALGHASATAMPGYIGRCGRSAARWSTRTTRS